ncbi:vWA domain-containing protein [Catelliglobosispora koreensis]|uniref:vWA domain-containing protein n=1 Tax=Catelliglobosispora koreensis TaxID=129052 RepID=UPI00037FC3E4|nr:hypothetical protein [Catelliglobosispora koreensis]
MARKKPQPDPRFVAFEAGYAGAKRHPFFHRVGSGAAWQEDLELVKARGYARVRSDGSIVVNKNARLEPDEWTWVIAHCLLHLGFGHLDADRSVDEPSFAAACLVVTRFQHQLKLGEAPIAVPADLPGGDESRLAEVWRALGVPAEMKHLGCGGAAPDHEPGLPPRSIVEGKEPTWVQRFAIGLASAAANAVEEAGERTVRQKGEIDPDNPWEQARRWFVTAFPLLAALAAGFKIVADAELARSWQISVAAFDASVGEIYANREHRFVLAHEMLHAALRHGDRVGLRDPYQWNVAADYVINGWLVEMGVGQMPEDCLYDPALKGRGAEDVYDEIVRNLRRYRKLATLRGRGLGDMISGARGDERQRGGDLDDFYRRALLGGLSYHEQSGRGLLPSGLVEEIRVLEHPPPPWEVELARWFDRHFAPLERLRSFARASRRQASTPAIPRPGWVRPEVPVQERTFGIVLGTSGSMDPAVLGKALGAIASYTAARDVPAARIVFCDAAAYDAGYVAVEDIAGRVRVRGRGGTVLQPGVNLLEHADDFPLDGPILIITDGACDVLRIRREHAFLLPRGATLPFTPRGEVFRIKP